MNPLKNWMYIYKLHNMKTCFLLFLTLGVLAIWSHHAIALSPEDILIVYNSTMPESRDIALYYAKKRTVPETNLVGVSVSQSEKILREAFDTALIPKVREGVKKAKKTGRTPVVLLVYGIPITVRDSQKKDKAKFMDLMDEKAKEYQELIWLLTSQLDTLIKNNSQEFEANDYQKPTTGEETLKIAGKSIFEASKYLMTQKVTKEDIETYIQATSLVIRLTGISPTARLLKKQLMAKKDSTAIAEETTFLKLDSILYHQLAQIQFKGVLPEEAIEKATIIRLAEGIIGEFMFWKELKELYLKNWTSASVDSELTHVLDDSYQLSGWLPNPFLKRYDTFPLIKTMREKTIMVGRLDAPTPELTRRLIDDAIEIEHTGLNGVFYIDARGLKTGATQNSYSLFDQRLSNLYKIVKNKSSMEVVFDNTQDVFQPDTCPNAALYCGWYSLANYIDAFKWQKGSLGFHVASAEASTLKKQGSNVWCKRMIEEGVAATLGPVEEPYLSSFPLPDVFFPLLMAGKLSLLEVYFQSTPYLSWRQILIGDPLYTPFKKNPAISFTEKKKTNGNSSIKTR